MTGVFARLARAWTLAPTLHSPVHYNRCMLPRIAIPLPHSGDSEYAERALPQYVHAVEMAGGEAVRIPLDLPQAEVMKLIEACDGVLLPGSKSDVDPAKYGASKDPHTALADSRRDAVDELLLQNAYATRKPIFGICYGLQILNVYRGGTLLQHIESGINHEAGRAVAIAHTVEVDAGSRLRGIVAPDMSGKPTIGVNSSHHQSAQAAGNGLCIVARCPQDGIIEALEGTSPDHFVVAVQWHPERSVEDDEASRAIFRSLVDAAQMRPGTTAREHAIRRV
jgi:putative glutamine amidotransferase